MAFFADYKTSLNVANLFSAPAINYSCLPVTDKNKRDINELIRIIAQDNLWHLTKNSLRAYMLRRNIMQVHPLKFLEQILSKENIRYLQNILTVESKLLKLIKNQFLSNLQEALNREQQNNNLMQYIKGFVDATSDKTDDTDDYVQKLQQHAVKKEWEEFIFSSFNAALLKMEYS
jgi:hypothetical protein